MDNVKKYSRTLNKLIFHHAHTMKKSPKEVELVIA